MENKWKEIWEKSKVDEKKLNLGEKDVFLELKRCDGFDVVGGGLTYEALIKQYQDINNKINNHVSDFSSVYEVGCGAGANLFLYEGEDLRCGGIDFSGEQIRISKKVLQTTDLVCDEAIKIAEDPRYDIVLANSVFSYFPTYEYAIEVLEKAYNKCNKGIVLIDLHDICEKENFIKYRKETIENYEELYNGLDKLFFDKKLFCDFADKNDMLICFEEEQVAGYWNNNFTFNCYMFKK